MNDNPRVFVAGDDDASRLARSALARHNVIVLGAGMAAGMSIEQASALCVPLKGVPPRPKAMTDEDRRRIAAAEDKRNRRAAKRATKEAK